MPDERRMVPGIGHPAATAWRMGNNAGLLERRPRRDDVRIHMTAAKAPKRLELPVLCPIELTLASIRLCVAGEKLAIVGQHGRQAVGNCLAAIIGEHVVALLRAKPPLLDRLDPVARIGAADMHAIR